MISIDAKTELTKVLNEEGQVFLKYPDVESILVVNVHSLKPPGKTFQFEAFLFRRKYLFTWQHRMIQKL